MIITRTKPATILRQSRNHIGCRAALTPYSGATRSKVSWHHRLSNFFGQAFAGNDRVDPKKILERRYLYFGIMALRLRELRQDSKHSHLSTSELRLKSVEELDSDGIDNLTNRGLRAAYQEAVKPQLEHILQSFAKVDEQIFGKDSEYDDASILEEEEEEEAGNKTSVPSSPLDDVSVDYLKDILREEHAQTLEDLGSIRDKQQQQSAVADQVQLFLSRINFLKTKHSALTTLLQFHGIPTESKGEENVTGGQKLDVFGMERVSHENFELVRGYQTLNICRSALIRKELGYSILCLRSTLNQDAGRGVFVDGKCQMGDLLAFQPGDVWPKEHLTSDSVDIMNHFEDEVDECLTSLRFDDFLLDSRRSPVTVLTQEGSFNPWALGHMVNHPNKGSWPNCQSLMLDFEENLQEELTAYIPNTYAREGTWKTNIFGQRNAVMMHGLCLMSRRDCANEELYYDYRLQSEELPGWYDPVIYNDEFMDQGRIVFFKSGPKKDEILQD